MKVSVDLSTVLIFLVVNKTELLREIHGSQKYLAVTAIMCFAGPVTVYCYLIGQNN